MGGSKSGNSEAINFEKEQAAKAEKKDAERTARLKQGMDIINTIYDGSPVYENVTKAYDWGGFKAPAAGAMPTQDASGNWIPAGATGAPAGYKAIQVAPRAPAAPAAGGGRTNALGMVQRTAAPASQRYTGGSGIAQGGAPLPKGAIPYTVSANGKDVFYGPGPGGSSSNAAASNAGKVWALQGPDGKIYYQGDALSYTDKHDTGKKTGGFDDIYNKYEQDYLGLYQPEEARQFGVSNRDLTYNLARQGILDSTAAAEKQGELGAQHTVNTAQIVADASTEKAKYKQSVLDQKKAVINQLYATEDPTVAQNLASSSASASKLQNPTLSPGTQFFAPALSAVGSFAANQTSPYNYGRSGGGSGVGRADANRGKLS